MKKSAIKDYVEDYLNKRAVQLGADGYTKWLANSMPDLASENADKIKRLTTDHQKSRIGYGNVAEGLRKSGLLGSGYAEYLDTRAKASYESELAQLKGESVANEDKAVKGYEQYLKEYDEDLTKRINQAYKAINTYDIMDYGTALLTATEYALEGKHAETVAKKATEATRRKWRRRALERIIDKEMTRNQAAEYARGLGLTDTDVTRLADVADMLRSFPSLDASQINAYAQYLEDIKN